MEKEWYLSLDDGQRVGPIGLEELQDRIRANPDKAKGALVWSEGMPDWVSPEKAGILQGAQPAPSISSTVSRPIPEPVTDTPATLAESQHNPYQPPQASANEVESLQYPGINRLTFFLGSLGIIILMVIGLAATLGFGSIEDEDPDIGPVFVIVTVAGMIGIIVLAVLRVRNVGKSGWWYLTILIPIYNIWTQIVVAAAPTGYEDTGEFDTAGKVIAGLYIAYLVLNFILSISGAAG